MPPVKLSKVTFPPPKPSPTPVSEPLPGDPVLPPFDPTLPDTGVDLLPVQEEPPTSIGDEPPTSIGDTTLDPTVGTFAAAAKRPTSGGDDVSVGIPTELVDKLWRAVEIVPGLTIETALTLALQQFLATLPDDYEREDG